MAAKTGGKLLSPLRRWSFNLNLGNSKLTRGAMKLDQDRVIRVFISSTFRDMHAERDHLVTVAFPELRERIEQLGLEFFDVDLRWGVPEKTVDGEQANSWEYCRQWIDRVEPFFVCILGQRYGWVPSPKELKAEEDRQRQQAELGHFRCEMRRDLGQRSHSIMG